MDGSWSCGTVITVPYTIEENLNSFDTMNNPPIPRNRGIIIKIYSSQYAERKLATSRASPMA